MVLVLVGQDLVGASCLRLVFRVRHVAEPFSEARWRHAVAILAINMLEAAAMDASQGYAINALAAILLIGASLLGLSSATVAGRTRWHVVRYDLPWIWLLGFTLWDACLVYLNWGGYAFGQHVEVLGAALAVAILPGRQTWLHARAEPGSASRRI